MIIVTGGAGFIGSNLVKGLNEQGIEDILVRSRNSLAVDPGKFDCDYYQAMEGDVTALNQFHGEYMRQYSWAEFTIGTIAAQKVFKD